MDSNLNDVWNKIVTYSDQTGETGFHSSNVLGLFLDDETELKLKQCASHGFIELSHDVAGYFIKILRR